jgi:hypothetical protein
MAAQTYVTQPRSGGRDALITAVRLVSFSGYAS